VSELGTVLDSVMETTSGPTPASNAWAVQFTELLHDQRNRACEFLAARQAQVEQAAAFIEKQLAQLEEGFEEQREEAERLRTARDAMALRLTQTESRLSEAEKHLAERSKSGEGSTADDDLQRRYEMAVEDIRQSRSRINELQQQLASARSTATKLAQQVQTPGRLSWEAEKQRILAALESEMGQTPEAQNERLKIEDVIRNTDVIIAAKDHEIEALQQQLEEERQRKSEAPGDVVSISKESILDANQIVQEERERLNILKEEWREKLLQAEVEISLERAKIARQRAELEELRATNRTAPAAKMEPETEQAERATHGRWLARLGLTNADREPPRRR